MSDDIRAVVAGILARRAEVELSAAAIFQAITQALIELGLRGHSKYGDVAFALKFLSQPFAAHMSGLKVVAADEA